MSDNVDRSLVDYWKSLRAENSEERRFMRLIETEFRTSGSSAVSLDDQVSRARNHVRARRGALRPLAPVIQLHAFD
jgi:hypothetical protein